TPSPRATSSEVFPDGTFAPARGGERERLYADHRIGAVRRLPDPARFSPILGGGLLAGRDLHAAQRPVRRGLLGRLTREGAEQLLPGGDRLVHLAARRQALHRVGHVPGGPRRVGLLAQRRRVPVQRRRARIVSAAPRLAGLVLEPIGIWRGRLLSRGQLA